MSNIYGKEGLKGYYKQQKLAQTYLDQRFTFPLGRVLHEKQVQILNKCIYKYKLKNILELACGPGRITFDIKLLQNSRCMAVDFSEEMLKIAEERKRILNKGEWILSRKDVFNMDLGEKFDLIYSIRFVRHFRKAERKEIYKIVKGHLHQKGFFILDVVNKKVSLPVRVKEGLDKYPVYDKLYRKEEFIREIEHEGFCVKEMIPVHPWYEILRAIQIYLGPRSDKLTYLLLKFIEFNFKGNNLEWVAICQVK